MFRLFGKKTYKKNLERFLFYINEIIEDANSQYSTPDCRQYLQAGINRAINASENQIEKWTPQTNVEMYAHKIIYNTAFDMLTSGKLHIYAGELNPLEPSDKLLYLVDKCLEYYVLHGIATQKDVENQKSYLWKQIHNVG